MIFLNFWDFCVLFIRSDQWRHKLLFFKREVSKSKFERVLFELTLCTKDNYRSTIMGLENGGNGDLNILVVIMNP